jgi:hypothetical protein
MSIIVEPVVRRRHDLVIVGMSSTSITLMFVAHHRFPRDCLFHRRMKLFTVLSLFSASTAVGSIRMSQQIRKVAAGVDAAESNSSQRGTVQ